VRVYGPEIPDEVEFGMLDRDVRARLRTLSKDNAGIVGRHLVMTGRLLDEDPELAYEHAQAAVRHGGRVDVVREAAGLAAYRTGRFAEALRELRTVRRLNGSSEHLAVMADCERGLGRPERALTLAASPEAEQLDVEARTELAMVVSGARLDMGDPDAAIAALAGLATGPVKTLLAARVAQARADALRAAGRTDEADATEAAVPAALLAQVADGGEEEDDVVVFTLGEDDVEDGEVEDGDAEGHGDATGGERASDVVDAPDADTDAAVTTDATDDDTDEVPVADSVTADTDGDASDAVAADEADAHADGAASDETDPTTGTKGTEDE
jgi:hypothetical protein